MVSQDCSRLLRDYFTFWNAVEAQLHGESILYSNQQKLRPGGNLEFGTCFGLTGAEDAMSPTLTSYAAIILEFTVKGDTRYHLQHVMEAQQWNLNFQSTRTLRRVAVQDWVSMCVAVMAVFFWLNLRTKVETATGLCMLGGLPSQAQRLGV